MAKFNGIPLVTGTIGPVCIYQMYGRYYLRTRSSLTGERVKKDVAFRKTMQYAALLARASRIGSTVYAAIPAHKKQPALYRKLTGEAMTWLKYQWTEADIIAYLLRQFTGQEAAIPDEPKVTVLREPYRHKTLRIRPYTRGGKRKLRQLLKEAARKEAARIVKLPSSLYAYRNQERMFRKEYNKELTTFPWATYLLSSTG